TRLIALTRQKPHWLVVRDERVKPDFGQAFFYALLFREKSHFLTQPKKYSKKRKILLKVFFWWPLKD
ncbi:TPA: hypothetical protein I7753_14805, partial [Vibrio vulnificus]|nr:hypothetical protein [Vibrio vulnificus]